MKKKIMLLLVVLLLIPAAIANSGSMKLLAVSSADTDNPQGSIADLELEIREGSGIFLT